MEIKTEVRVFKTDYQCQHCSKGVVSNTSTFYNTNGSIEYLHICDNCGLMVRLDTTYPKIEYIPENVFNKN